MSIKFINGELKYPKLILYIFGKLSGLNSLKSSFESNGVKCVGTKYVLLSDLNAFRAVRCEIVRDKSKETIGFLDDYFLDDWKMKKSFHCKLFQLYLKGKLPKNWIVLDYWKWHVSLDQSGINNRPSEWIESKIRNAIRLCENIDNKGFKDKYLFNLPWVLNKPLIKTRYDIDHKIKGFEVLDGHHRVAAMIALGYKKIRVLEVVDVATKTPFNILLSEINT